MSVATRSARSAIAPGGMGPTDRLGTVSPYEKVASTLLAALVMVVVIVFVLFMIWLSFKVFSPTLPVAVELIDESDFGGYADGVLGESMQIDGPPTEEIAQESDLPTEPAIEKVMETMLDAVATIPADLADPNLSEEVESGGAGGSEGDGNAPALGEGGGGKGGVRRGQRWIVRYQEGGSLDVYAQQLDFFGIELGALGGGDNQVQYAANLSTNPTSRNGSSEQEDRLYFSWQNGALQQADRDLLGRAGVNVAGKIVVQFYPQNTENSMAAMELDYLRTRHPGRDLRQVRRTFFTVQTEGNGYKFVITDQTYF